MTELLHRLQEGDQFAKDRLFSLLYGELHTMATRAMGRQRRNELLSPTALVNEAYLRLFRGPQRTWKNRRHFLGMAAIVMRRVLIDEYRKAARRLPQASDERLPSGVFGIVVGDRSLDLLDVHEALQELSATDATAARIAELRLFGGLSVAEAGAEAAVPERSARRSWNLGLAWLRRRLRQADDA